MPKNEPKWTLVQHSGFVRTQHVEFEHGVEVMSVRTAKEERTVTDAGGVVFDTYEEATAFEEAANYPPGVDGLIPHVEGTFHPAARLDGLPVYIPIREVMVIR